MIYRFWRFRSYSILKNGRYFWYKTKFRFFGTFSCIHIKSLYTLEYCSILQCEILVLISGYTTRHPSFVSILLLNFFTSLPRTKVVFAKPSDSLRIFSYSARILGRSVLRFFIRLYIYFACSSTFFIFVYFPFYFWQSPSGVAFCASDPRNLKTDNIMMFLPGKVCARNTHQK